MLSRPTLSTTASSARVIAERDWIRRYSAGNRRMDRREREPRSRCVGLVGVGVSAVAAAAIVASKATRGGSAETVIRAAINPTVVRTRRADVTMTRRQAQRLYRPSGEKGPAPYQDVLDFAYYSGWRKREWALRPERPRGEGGPRRFRTWQVAGGCCLTSRKSPNRSCYGEKADRTTLQRAGSYPMVFRRIFGDLAASPPSE